MTSSPERDDDAWVPDWDEVWVLSMAQSEAPEGKSWFRQMTGIGPMGTWNFEEAASFPSEQAATQSPAYAFPLTFYRPEKVAP